MRKKSKIRLLSALVGILFFQQGLSLAKTGSMPVLENNPQAIRGNVQIVDVADWGLDGENTYVFHVFVNTHPKKKYLYRPAYTQFTREALDQWSLASLGRFKFVVVDQPKQAHIRIHWVDSLYGKSQKGQEAKRFANNVQHLTDHGEVEYSDVRVQTWNNPEKGKQSSDSLVKLALLREIGSALGVDYSNDLEDVMCGMHQLKCQHQMLSENSAAYEPRLTTGDMGSLRKIYQIDWKKDYPSNLMAHTPLLNPVQPKDVSTFFGLINRQIQKEWQYPGAFQNKKVIVRMVLDASGKLLDAQIKQSSDISVLDESALQAIKKAAPFSPIPKGYPSPTVTLDFSFTL